MSICMGLRSGVPFLTRMGTGTRLLICWSTLIHQILLFFCMQMCTKFCSRLHQVYSLFFFFSK
ncbi:protein hothead [Phtheirospermum japonicum]|uniref:Protein hothead n=1 Tax=Phtheirospermum japonicum TaxID=374723 RepID=A0A830BTC4_9LAMI|nr:protein hothead [Phtheirospermum japonicum]